VPRPNSALFEASSAALRALAADPKYLGSDRLGFSGVLHIWGRTLEYHPHVHYVVPGGGLSGDGDRRIVSCDDAKVTFTYRRVGSHRPRKMTLDAMKFLRRFLQHVLPAGFQKVRHFGFFSPGSSTSLETVRWLITLHNTGIFRLMAMLPAPPAELPAPRWWASGGLMFLLGFAAAPAIFDTS
jgi:hypothetical protein